MQSQSLGLYGGSLIQNPPPNRCREDQRPRPKAKEQIRSVTLPASWVPESLALLEVERKRHPQASRRHYRAGSSGAVARPRWSSLAARFAPTPIAPLGHSLRCVGGRPSAAPAVTSCQARLQTLPVVAFVRQALFRASFQGGLGRCGVVGRGARCQRLRRFYRGYAPPRLRF